jgi:hypothetical protein
LRDQGGRQPVPPRLPEERTGWDRDQRAIQEMHARDPGTNWNDNQEASMKSRFWRFSYLVPVVCCLVVGAGAVSWNEAVKKHSKPIDLSTAVVTVPQLPAGSKDGATLAEGFLEGTRHDSRAHVTGGAQWELMTMGDFNRLFSPAIVPIEGPAAHDGTPVYVITIDVDKTVESRGKVLGTSHQDVYLVDPVTGKIISYGYRSVPYILPAHH